MRIFLSGPMGAGKSTVGRALAQRLKVPFVDLDERIEQRVGMDIPTLFNAKGEAGFRQVEGETLAALLAEAGDEVVGLGGGTVTNAALRRRILAQDVLITLRAPPEVLASRVAGTRTRPLLAGRDAAIALSELIERRADAYAEAHAVIETGGLSVDAIVERARQAAKEVGVVVPLGRRTYVVEIGPRVRSHTKARCAGWSRALVVCDTNTRQWADQVSKDLLDPIIIQLEPGERHKTLASVEQIWNAALEAGVDRDAGILAVGGGVVGDVAGLAASTLLRGVAFGQVPTTVVAMVDSAVGGKTGIDRAQGKNLVGTFHQPRFVLADVETLSTLDSRERVAGLAEVVKSAWLDGERSVELVESLADALREGDADATAKAVRMSVSLKARIVSEDETEKSARRLLNLGHTIGHALETGSGYTLRHGEAISLGLVAAFRVAEHRGRAVSAYAERMIRLLTKLGLPTDLDAHMTAQKLAFVGADKKRSGAHVHFVLPAAPGQTEIAPISLESLLAAVVRKAAVG